MAADLRAHLEAGLDDAHRARLEQVRRAAAGLGLPTYLAGGLVRDLLLGRPTTDLDFVVVSQHYGDPPPAATLARAMAQAQGGEVTVHTAFGTSTWHSADGAALDFATARTETYSRPGALPTVTPASDIETDLRRRDFTANAMAIRVDGEHLGKLVDPHGGQADLSARIIRVLHPQSLQDDPTRIFRAVRYTERLGFRLDDATERLIPAALPVIRVLSGERIRYELEMIFREQLPPVALARLQALSALAAIDEALRWGEEATTDAGVIRDLPRPTWQWAAPLDVDSIYLTLLLRVSAPGQVAQALERLSVTRPVQEAVSGALGLVLAGARPSDVVAQLEPLSLDGVVAAYVAQPAARDRIDTYLSRWRFIRAKITGDDLIAMGLPPGPRFKRILGRLRAARLDGEVDDEAGELALVRELAGLE